MSDASGRITEERRGEVLVVVLDDGKANVYDHELIDHLHGVLDRGTGAGAIVLAGRPGRFSAGFDLSVMQAGPKEALALVRAGGELMMRIYGYERPVVAACTGHAVAAGALMLLSCDTRIGADVPAKIGLNETSIGMHLPFFAIELARARLSPRAVTRACIQAELFDAPGAVAAGYLDRTAPADGLLDEAVAEGERLAALSASAYAETKRRIRGGLVERVQATIDDDLGPGAPWQGG